MSANRCAHIRVNMRTRLRIMRTEISNTRNYALVFALRMHSSVKVIVLQQQKSRNSENPKAHRGGNISSSNLGNLPDKAKSHRITWEQPQNRT